jgi:hypothetical protein
VIKTLCLFVGSLFEGIHSCTKKEGHRRDES